MAEGLGAINITNAPLLGGIEIACVVLCLIPKIHKMIDLVRNNCLHSLTEYNNLASFLPQLYKEMGGKIV